MKRVLLLFFMAVWSPLVHAATIPSSEVEHRAMALQKQFRCLVCQGESLDESNAPLAEDLRQIIRERIRAGDNDEQVKDYLVARYGSFILMKPPVEGDTYLLWMAPGLLLLAGGIALLLVTRNARRRRAGETNASGES